MREIGRRGGRQGPWVDGVLAEFEGGLGMRWDSCNVRMALCKAGRLCISLKGAVWVKDTGPEAAAGCIPPPLSKPLHGSVAPLLKPSRRAAWWLVTTRGRCLRSRVPPPLSIGLCCHPSAPLDSFPSAPWAWRSRLRTGSWPGARRGSCCRLRGGGGNGGCGGGGASGRASGGSRARPGSPSS